jgi:Asp-tRNA(Asn)/Glu-tRNA(Gln) amidotransferase A subunit family amidase
VSDLHTLTGARAASLIAHCQLSPVDLLDALLGRIARLDPKLHVWAALDADGARAQARERTEEAARGAMRGTLHGVPLGVKDIFDVAGLPTRGGSRVYHAVPDADATTVARLRRAGAVIVGKTHTTEFAYADPAPTRNPWNPSRTPGGSSSGSAAGVAAGMMPVALGSQTAGSVLRPAAFCGVVGYKPTYGRISRQGVLPLAWSLDHVGTLTRSVEDAALLAGVMAGPDRKDPTCADVPVPDLVAAVRDPHPPRIGIVGDVYPDRLSDAARDRLSAIVVRLETAGAEMEQVRLPREFDAALDAHHVIMSAEMSGIHLAGVQEQGEAYGSRLRAAVESGALIPAAAYLRALRLRRVIRAAILPLFEEVDCLIAPAAAGAAPEGLDSTGDPSFNAPWSLLGLPAISLPAGLDTQGLPLAVQLVAGPWQDARLLGAAAWCEVVLGQAVTAPV